MPIPRLLLTLLATLLLLAPGLRAEPVHPRLIFGPEDVESFRAKAGQEPYASIIKAIEEAVERDAWGYETSMDSANTAGLYVITGDEKWAEQAADLALAAIADPETWHNSNQMSIRRSFYACQVAYVYDWCYHSKAFDRTVPAKITVPGGEETYDVPGDYDGMTYRQALSKALAYQSDLLFKEGGRASPRLSDVSSNWLIIRFAGCIIAALASDEPVDERQIGGAMSHCEKYWDNVYTTDPKAGGWSPEGSDYNAFAGRFTALLCESWKRIRGHDLTEKWPAIRKAAWSTLPVLVPIEYDAGDGKMAVGMHPDVADESPSFSGEGMPAWALNWAHAPADFPTGEFDYRPGVKWMLENYWGDKWGDGTWGGLRGSAPLTYFFWPDDTSFILVTLRMPFKRTLLSHQHDAFLS